MAQHFFMWNESTLLCMRREICLCRRWCVILFFNLKDCENREFMSNIHAISLGVCDIFLFVFDVWLLIWVLLNCSKGYIFNVKSFSGVYLLNVKILGMMVNIFSELVLRFIIFESSFNSSIESIILTCLLLIHKFLLFSIHSKELHSLDYDMIVQFNL